jgi:hypothetical protein
MMVYGTREKALVRNDLWLALNVNHVGLSNMIELRQENSVIDVVVVVVNLLFSPLVRSIARDLESKY